MPEKERSREKIQREFAGEQMARDQVESGGVSTSTDNATVANVSVQFCTCALPTTQTKNPKSQLSVRIIIRHHGGTWFATVRAFGARNVQEPYLKKSVRAIEAPKRDRGVTSCMLAGNMQERNGAPRRKSSIRSGMHGMASSMSFLFGPSEVHQCFIYSNENNIVGY